MSVISWSGGRSKWKLKVIRRNLNVHISWQYILMLLRYFSQNWSSVGPVGRQTLPPGEPKHYCGQCSQTSVCAGVSEVLSSVVDDIGQAVSRNVSGAQLLHELLCAPWLRALLKVQPESTGVHEKQTQHHWSDVSLPVFSHQMYECLLQFQRLTPSPFLPYASGLSHEVTTPSFHWRV